MMKGAVGDVTQAIGGTPIVKLGRMAQGLEADIYCKLEYLNPAGSMKDRIGLNIINQAEKRGELVPGSTIVEATSGNTGMGLAMASALRGYKCVFVMPDKQSMEKVKMLRAAGAKVVITPTNVEPEDPRSYYSVAKKIVADTPDAFLANQYHNQDNPQTHYDWTGPEIWEQTGGELDVFCAGLGTGGTITGTGTYLKEQKSDIKLVGADAVGSVYYDFWKTGKVVDAFSYTVEGIGEDFFPSTINLGIVDHVYQITDKDCFLAARALAREEGIYTGGSGGAAVAAAIAYAEETQRKENILVLLPDRAARYLNKVFDDDWMRENGYLDAEENLGSVRDLLAGKQQEVFSVGRRHTVREVVGLMKEQGISQVPVVEDNRLVGIVNETTLLRYVTDTGGSAFDDPVAEVVSDAFELADPDAPLGHFRHIWKEGKVIVVWERGQVRGIITKIDVIDYMAHRGRAL